jgi:signal transduction histidine kinase
VNQKRTILELNQKILSQSQLIEESAILKERNRIAEDMHDTVGHTLTASIVSLEGVEMLISTNPYEAISLLNRAKSLLKDSLSDVRGAVKNLKADTFAKGVTFNERLENLVHDVRSGAGVTMQYENKLEVKLVSLYEFVLYNMVKEGITNALRHGGANVIRINLHNENSIVTVIIEDNGRGSSPVEYGFGLTNLNNRILALGGEVIAYTNKEGGFVLRANLPMMKDLRGEGEND